MTNGNLDPEKLTFNKYIIMPEGCKQNIRRSKEDVRRM
jgi:hypothetical protein